MVRLPQRPADSAAVPDDTVIYTAGAVSGLPGQLPVAQAAPVAREYNEPLAGAQAKYPGRFYGTAKISVNDTSQAVAMADEAVKEFGLAGVNRAG